MMNTTKKLTLSLLAVSTLFLATNSFADDANYEYKKYKNAHHKGEKCGSSEYKKYKNCDRGSKNHHKGHKGRFIIGAVYSLDLSKEQEAKIDTFMKEYQEKRKTRYELFNDDGFNKEAYIKMRMNKEENMIKAKANLIESIYSILTKEQKTKLKEEMESFKKDKRNKK